MSRSGYIVFDPPRCRADAEDKDRTISILAENLDTASRSIIIVTMVPEVLHKRSAAGSDGPGKVIEAGLKQINRRGRHA